MDGAANSAVEALEFYKEFYKSTPPGYTNAYGESLDAFKSGQVAMAMNGLLSFRVCMRIRTQEVTRRTL